MGTFTAQLAPVGGSLGLSALVACIPLVTFFIMLLGAKAKTDANEIRQSLENTKPMTTDRKSVV